jgi:integral membrane protein
MLKFLARIGFMEGISFITLLFVAMPLKYWFGLPSAVSIIGSVHGALFLLYLGILLLATVDRKIPIWAFPVGILGSILPFGPFVFDSIILERIRIQESQPTSP